MQWQERLDEDFPNGLILSLDTEDWTFRVPRPRVVEVEGFVPLVTFENIEADGKGHVLPLVTYEVVREEPRLVRATSTSGTWWLNGNLGPALTEFLAKARRGELTFDDYRAFEELS